MEADEVDDVVVDDSVVEVADGSAENEREGDTGERKAVAGADEHDADNEDGDDGEEDEAAAYDVGRGGVCEEAEGRAGVEDVGDVEKSRKNGVGAAHGKMVADKFFADVVGDGDEGRERKQERKVETAPIGGTARLGVELGRRVLVTLGHLSGLLRRNLCG